MKQKIRIKLIERNTGQIEGVHPNPRVIKDAKFDKLVESIKRDVEFLEHRGPVVFPYNGKYVTICGNMRYEAGKSIGMKELWCEILPADTPPEKLNDYILLDNANFGDWDFEGLANFDADALSRYDIDIPDIDLSTGEDPTEAEEDNYEIPEHVETDIKVGDIFEIRCNGLTHRIMCGDSLNPDHIDSLMNGKKADLLVTDPPYNVDYGQKAKFANKGDGGKRNENKIMNDNMTDAQFKVFLTDAFKQATRALKPGGSFYVYYASREAINFGQALRDNGLTDRQQLIWVKNTLVLGRQDYQWRHEPILYGWKDGGTHYFINDRSLTTVLEESIDVEKMSKAEMKEFILRMLDDVETAQTIAREDKPMRNSEHPTMKPVKLIGRNIYHSSRLYDTVLDLFGGSGTTLIAADQLKRNACLMEFDPKYTQVIIDRYQKLQPECNIRKLQDQTKNQNQTE